MAIVARFMSEHGFLKTQRVSMKSKMMQTHRS